METNKFNGTNYTDCLRNLRIVLDFEKQGYVLDKLLPTALPEGSSPEERLTFEKWHEDNCKVRNIILASMTNEIQKYAAKKAFFGTKMAEGSSVQSHGRGFDLQGERQGARRWKRKKGKGTAVIATASSRGGLAAPKGKGKGKVGGSQRSKANDVRMHCQGKEHWKRECPQLLSNQVLERSRKLSKDEMILRLGDGKAVAAKAVGLLA
ncbi:UNVERIFIED_CONTAM: hypothetical protein Slati_4407600 [Sesamum latifolium]|uniref:Uncharacterized protein n=1 Tax=Sesamum latifolium TaxID=2727402 RepID=A0AAW2SQK1_9LAMI